MWARHVKNEIYSWPVHSNQATRSHKPQLCRTLMPCESLLRSAPLRFAAVPLGLVQVVLAY